MALNAEQQWWVRKLGSELNGGGFDSTISGAGINYADQDSPQLSLSNLATPGAGSTTLTSASGLFTSAMIGNIIRIASGTNFDAGYYAVVAFVSSTQVTLDRTASSGGAGNSGVGRLGGAHDGLYVYANGGAATPQPAIATPLAAGHTINFRGAQGLSDPTIADWTANSYYTFPSGDYNTGGSIAVIGYNGRPLVSVAGAWRYSTDQWYIKNISFITNASAFGTFLLTGGLDTYESCIIDQSGQDVSISDSSVTVLNCWLRNSGFAFSGSQAAIIEGQFGNKAIGNLIDGWCGGAIEASNIFGIISRNIIINSPYIGAAVRIPNGGGSSFPSPSVIGNMIAFNTGSGIEVSDTQSAQSCVIRSNILYGNGGYGVLFSSGGPLTSRSLVNYNAYGSNTSGSISGIPAGANDVTLSGNPFTNSAGGDFSLNNTAGAGAACRAVGWPNNWQGTVGYIDIGGVQHQDPTGGTGLNLYAVE